MIRPPPRSTLFPHTTLLRSAHAVSARRIKSPVRPLPFRPQTVVFRMKRPERRVRRRNQTVGVPGAYRGVAQVGWVVLKLLDRKSTRLNSINLVIPYAVFGLT